MKVEQRVVADDAMHGSAGSFSAFAHVATDLGHRAGFTRCAVRVSRTADMCDVVSLHGDAVDPHGVPFVPGGAVPNADVKKMLAAGVAFGALTFCAVEWRGTTGAVLPDERAPWQAGDFLIALARDMDGNVRGSVLMDAPVDGMRPDRAALISLSEELHLAISGLLSTIENEDLSHQLKVARQMRELVRELDLDTTLDDLISLAREQMRVAFRADDVVPYLDGDGEDPPIGELVASSHLHHALEELVQHAWVSHALLVVEHDGLRGGAQLDQAATDELLSMMAEHAIATLVMVPIGVGDHAMGALGVIRRLGTPRWTLGESEAAVEVGRDLGRAVLNARRHEREQHLRQELERLDERRSQMVSTISHELKNPIGVIQGHLELLADSPATADPGVMRSLSAIARGAGRLAILADDMLVLSRVGDQEHPLDRRSVDLGALVTEAVEFARVTSDQAGVSVEVEALDECVDVEGDADALRLVVTNLLSNAVKYTDPGGQVRVKVLRRGRRVVLVCTDTGLGISEADRSRLFKEFFRSTNPAATKRPGTGLGLVILQRVVARHGGHVEVDSELGVGTTFRISFPVQGRERLGRGTATVVDPGLRRFTAGAAEPATPDQ